MEEKIHEGKRELAGSSNDSLVRVCVETDLRERERIM